MQEIKFRLNDFYSSFYSLKELKRKIRMNINNNRFYNTRISGIEAVEKIPEKHPNTKFLFLSRRLEQNTQAELIRLGIDYFNEKKKKLKIFSYKIH